MGSFGLSSVVFGDPWAALEPLDGHWGSICHLWGSIGAPLGRHWAPFVAFGDPLGRLWVSLGVTVGVTLRSLSGQCFTLGHCEHFYKFGDFFKRKNAP